MLLNPNLILVGKGWPIQSLVSAQSISIPAIVNAVQTGGYYNSGDGGGAAYNRVGADPGTPGKFQSADGAWWKLVSPVIDCRMLGAKGDGVTDDAPAINNALSLGGNIVLSGGTYSVNSRLTIAVAKTSFSGSGVIKPSATWAGVGDTLSILTIQADDVSVSGIVIDNANVVIGSNINFQIETFNKRTKITNTSLLNRMLIGGATGSCIAYRTTASYGLCANNIFDSCNGAVFCQSAYTAIDANVCHNPNDVAFVLNGVGCVGCTITNNVSSNDALSSLSAHIQVEEGAGNWVISGNNLFGLSGVGIGATNVSVFTTVHGGVIANNVIDGGSFAGAAICTGILISSNYTGCSIDGNDIRNIPTGSTNSRYIVVAANNVDIKNNHIDGSYTTDCPALVNINPGTGFINIYNNTLIAAPNTRYYLFAGGDFSSQIASFNGGSGRSGSVGIDTALNNPSNLIIYVENLANWAPTNMVNMGANMNWGERASFLNANGAKNWPHWIKVRTLLYGPNAPTTGAWLSGDRIEHATPIVGQPKGWICTVSGSPGTWVSTGNL